MLPNIVLAILIACTGFFMGWSVAYIVALLCILEISLSFDNAVVNAKVLETMEPKWRKRFITWGIPIAVFGMRFLFPIIIVAVASDLSWFNSLALAFVSPEAYHIALENAKLPIFAFGGAFLLMVFLSFFFDEDREHKWIKILESNIVTQKLSGVAHIDVLIALGVGYMLGTITDNNTVTLAYLSGIILHELIASLDDAFASNGVRAGIVGFIYLEVLDASFSFDGVIGAFALSSNIIVIMMGLGIGALYVRQLTLYFVEKKTLQEYKYLEHGAHYAIGALAAVMLLKMFFHVNEILIGTIGIGLIIIAVVHSVYEAKQPLKYRDDLL